MDKRDTGAIGENLFLSWCELEEFRAQKSQFDRFGWDYLLEHEPIRSPDRPLDSQNDLPKFLVQVKATEKVGTPPRIKLSALKHLVDADLPSAILVIFLPRDARRPHRSLLVPVDRVLIADTLRRVREEEARGNRRIHKVTVSVPVDRAAEIGATGEGLREALFGMLGGDASDYVASKIQFRRSCGYEGETVIGRFFVPGADAAARMNDVFLGKRRELGVEDLTIQHRRFGIALESDKTHFPEAVLTMDVPPLTSAYIELKTGDGEAISVEAGFWVSPPTEGGARLARFANSYLELEFDFDRREARLTLDYGGEREVDIEEAVSIVEVGSILASPERSVVVRFGSAKMEFPIGPEIGPFRNWAAAAPVLRRILTVVQRHPRTRRTVSLNRFQNWLAEHLEFLAVASKPGVHMIYPRWPDDGMVGDQDAILLPFSLAFLGTQYAALVEVPIASVSRTDTEITMVGGQPRVVSEVARPVGSDIDDFIDDAVERSKRERKKPGPALVSGGFSNWNSVSLSVG